MSCKTIYEKRGTFRFRDENKTQHKFATLEEAIAAGGTPSDEQVQVSGVPYTVSASSLSSAVDDAADVMSKYEESEGEK